MSDWRTGQGYGEQDMFWLFEKMRNRIKRENLPRNYRFSDADIEQMLV